jgi:hypothetical protein
MPTFTSNNTTPAVVAENTMVSTTISPGEGIKATSAGDAILAEGGVGLRAKTRKASGVAIIADAEGPNQALPVQPWRSCQVQMWLCKLQASRQRRECSVVMLT